jgi:hypothetical protein
MGVYDFVQSIKFVQQELYWLYCDLFAKDEDLTFNDFN